MKSRISFFIIAFNIFFLATTASSAPVTFVYCSEGSPRTFNPQMGSDGPTFNASSRTIYNRLVDFEKGGTKVVPSLATSWSISKSKTEITFHLRKNIQFQTTPWFKPTRSFNADDVVFTFNRMLKADHPYHKVNGGVYEYFTSMEMDKLLVVVKKVDAYTVTFVLSRPETPFIANMAMDFASILSAEYGDLLLKKGTLEKIDIEPIGTGPFKFVRYEKDSQIRFEANESYFAGKQKIDKLVFAITTEPSVRAQKLKRGECQLVAEPAVQDLSSLRQEANIAVLEKEGLNVGYLAFNTEKKPFSDVRVREAIAKVLNRKLYLDAVYQGQAMLAKNPIPPPMWSYNRSIQDTTFDVEGARRLLTAAGFPSGFETTLWYMPVTRPYNPNAKKMAEMMQADLKAIGVKAKLVTYDWSVYLDKARNGEHDLLMMGWTGDNGDPDNFLGTLLSCAAVRGGSNYSRWCNKEFDQLITEARQAPEQKTRLRLYLKAQEIFKKELPWVTIAHAKAFRAIDRNVFGYTMSPFGTDSFEGVSFVRK